MLLAAGRGQRMRPLTDHCPKPLLEVWGQSLLSWHLHNLARAGIEQVVINHAYLGQQIEQTLGDGNRWGLQIEYSAEAQALETAGGIANALSRLSDPFMAIAADVFCQFELVKLRQLAANWEPKTLAHVVLVPNPEHHLQGDFSLHHQRLVWPMDDSGSYTFSGIALYRHELFRGIEAGQSAALAPLLRQAAQDQRASAEVFSQLWHDIGTPERLAAINLRRR